uniref:Uncharacterized protein n=1 Tax=Nicotiana tabacum TaxID=4097 RepID=A0A1S3Z115_TOBAC|nr:PREDICTED: uncharacterized protein LOC107781605 [Nicotiana tabacum]
MPLHRGLPATKHRWSHDLRSAFPSGVFSLLILRLIKSRQFSVDASHYRGLGKDVVIRPLSGEEETSIPASKSVKDKKRKKISISEDPEPKKKKGRKQRKNIILPTEDSVRRLRDDDEEEEEDDSRLVARVKMSTETPKATKSVKAAEIPSRDEGVSGKECVKIPESSRIEANPHHNEPMARALKTLSIEGGHGREDPFRDYFTGVENATGLSDLEVPRKDSGEASSLFNEVQQALTQASVLHWEAFSRSRTELSRLDWGTLANILISQLQQKIEMTGQLREEVDMIKAEILGWKEGMDRFTTEKETALSQLSSAESVLRGMKEKSSAQENKKAELEAWLASELEKAKSKAEKDKVEADAIVAVYRADAEAAQAKEFEADAGVLASDDDDDDDESKSGSESGEELDGEETATGENQEPWDKRKCTQNQAEIEIGIPSEPSSSTLEQYTVEIPEVFKENDGISGVEDARYKILSPHSQRKKRGTWHRFLIPV